MKTYILVYDGFAVFESAIIGYLMCATKHDVIFISADGNPVTSYDGFPVLPHASVNQVDPDEVDLLVIPGGDPTSAVNHPQIQSFIRTLHEQNTTLAAICHGPILLAEAGVMKGKKYTSDVAPTDKEFSWFQGDSVQSDVVVDGHIITGKGTAYVEFAMEVCRQKQVFENEQDIESYYHFFKNRTS